MNTTWYCTDCETELTVEEVSDHEDDGHHVRGLLRPDRLIPERPSDVYATSETEVED